MKLHEAFRALKALDEDTFSVSDDGITKLANFQDNDDLVDEISVIDMDAETEADLQDSYVGKVILDCQVCHSKLYKDKEEVILNDDQTLANVGDECPYCYTSDGFKVVGEVAAFGGATEEPIEETPTDDIVDDNIVSDDDLTEGIFDNKAKKQQAYNKEIKEVCGKDATPFAYDIVKQATGLLQDVANAVCDEANSTALAQSLYDTIKNAKASIKKYPESLLRSIISMGRKYCYESSYHLEDLADNMKLMSKLQSNSKIGSKAREYLMDSINTKLVDSLNHTMSSLKREHNLREDVDSTSTLSEDVNNVNVETDDSIVNVSTDESGKVTVITEPNTNPVEGDEVIVPVTAETEDEITTNAEGEIATEGDFEEYTDADIEEFDEESFDELGESYLKKTYENVESYKTTNVSANENHIVVEGVIKFTSGIERKTKFIFEAKDATKSGKYRFLGENLHLAKGKKPFSICGKIVNNKFITESFSYNYRAKDNTGKSTRVYGRVTK